MPKRDTEKLTMFTITSFFDWEIIIKFIDFPKFLVNKHQPL